MSNGTAGLIWSIADLLRGSWKQHEYQDVILPFTVLRRLDCVLEKTKPDVLRKTNELKGKVDPAPIIQKLTGLAFHNDSVYDFKKLLDDQHHLEKNLHHYINGFSENILDIFEKFELEKHLKRLSGGNILYEIVKRFEQVDLHPDAVSNAEMGTVFEELLRKFAEMTGEEAGEHYTPREAIELMVEILFSPDKKSLQKQHLVKTIYDPCAGTGGMLTVSKDHIHSHINPDTDVHLYGQELNPISYAICKSEMLIKGEDPENIKGGEHDRSKASTLTNDQWSDMHFDYMLANPPYGVEWKLDKEAVEREADRGYAGRFGAGTPRISDGQLLFLQHMISKMRPEDQGGSRIAVVSNGSPLFTGDAGSGESEIRRWLLENDWLESIVALPDQMFYNTGISTYLWFLTNRKDAKHKGKVQLIDARSDKFYSKMRKSLGNKRKEINPTNRQKILALYETFEENEYSKIFKTTDFAFRQITVERPLRLNFQASPERIALFNKEKAFANLAESKKKGKAGEKDIAEGKELQKRIPQILTSLGTKLYKNREEFETDLDAVIKEADLKLKAPVKKAILSVLSERDESADICNNKDGSSESDSELRDTENVPYGEDPRTYFEREVLPYVPDAWINETVRDLKDNEIGKVGYEIPLTRYFYTYEPPRDLEEIETDIEKVENELLGLLKQL
jgi:type I restriction enzyme M protein